MTDMSLYQKLAEGIGFGHSERVQKMFAMIADEDEAKFLLAAYPPATAEEITNVELSADIKAHPFPLVPGAVVGALQCSP